MLRNGLFARAPSHRILIAPKRQLSFTPTNFTLDGAPTRLISGSVHYFRAPPSSWRRILRAARAMGLNAIETYVPWNLHEPTPGTFVFSGILDLRMFLEIAHEEGLLVLLRPGPYICAEWDMGGIPAWVLRTDVPLRSVPYLSLARGFFDVVSAQVHPYIGRPVVALQIENEFGAYGEDYEYMHLLRREWKRRALRNPALMLFTSDNGGESALQNGSPFTDGRVIKTVNLEKGAGARLELLRRIQPDAPAMVAEFWSGWYDHWGESHHRRSADDVVQQVRELLFEHDASVNLYMFFGGTNFGFMSGANIDKHGRYLPQTTSYDYDGFLSEDARIREDKYVPMQKMLRHFWKSVGNVDMVAAMPKKLPVQKGLSAYVGTVQLRESVPLLELLDFASERKFYSDEPVSMEDAGSGYGFVLYRHIIDHSVHNHASNALRLGPVRDFAYVICDGALMGTVERNNEIASDGTRFRRTLIPSGTSVIDVLVENRGRVNYGRRWLRDRKGLLSNVTLSGKPVLGFEVYPISFASEHKLLSPGNDDNSVQRIANAIAGRNEHPPLQERSSPPTFFRATMWISPGATKEFADNVLADTYVRVYGRGVIWINGFNLGRFNTVKPCPQLSLFVPGEVLREGMNEILVLHQNMYLVRGDPHPVVQFFSNADHGKKVPVYDSRVA